MKIEPLKLQNLKMNKKCTLYNRILPIVKEYTYSITPTLFTDKSLLSNPKIPTIKSNLTLDLYATIT